MVPPNFPQGEQAVLAACMLDGDCIPRVRAMLTPRDFYGSHNATIFETICQLDDRKKPVDLVTVAEMLHRYGRLDEVGGQAVLVDLIDAAPSTANVMHYVQVVKEKAILRSIARNLSGVVESCYKEGAEAQVIQDGLQKLTFDLVSKSTTSRYLKPVKDIVLGSVDRIEHARDRGLPSGFLSIDGFTKGFRSGELVIIGGRPSMGKAQPLESNVLLENGAYQRMGAIRVGDKLASVDGLESEVLAIHPQGVRSIFRVHLSDGRSIDADSDHIWDVESSKWIGIKQFTTVELGKLTRKSRYKDRTRLVGHCGNFGLLDDIGVDPWLLGFLLGDGCLTHSGVRFSNPEQYVHERVKKATGLALHGNSNNSCDQRIFHSRGIPNPIRESLAELGVVGLHSYEKFVPEVVFSGTRETRASVLAGLLESDGWVEKCNSVQFSSSSERLRDDVVRLVQSLGGCATKRPGRLRHYTQNRIKKEARPAYCTTIRLENIDKLVQSPRLLKNIRQRGRTSQPTISSVEWIKNDKAQCITVSHASGRYITDNYVVTHNSALATDIAIAATKRTAVAIFSMEMSEDELTTRLISKSSSVDLHRLRAGYVGEFDWPRITDAIGEIAEYPLFIDDSGSITPTQIKSRVQETTVRTGLEIGMVVVDYLQLMSTERKHNSLNERVSELTRSLKLLAKDLKTRVICLSQLNRQIEQRPFKGHERRPRMSDYRDSGSVEQDADIMIGLYRPEVYSDDEQYRGFAEAVILKQRNGPTGIAPLRWHPTTATFTDPPQTERSEASGDFCAPARHWQDKDDEVDQSKLGVF